jgi:hypothetical protein
MLAQDQHARGVEELRSIVWWITSKKRFQSILGSIIASLIHHAIDTDPISELSWETVSSASSVMSISI